MRIRVTPTSVHAEAARQIARSAVTFYVPDGSTGAGETLDALSDAEFERQLRENGRSYLAVDEHSIRIVADYQGAQHLYVRRMAAPPELAITDDPMTFAGSLPIDHDVAKLVPLMKFAPPPLSIVRGAERLPPGLLRVYDRHTLDVTGEESFLSDLYRIAARAPTHDEVRETLATIVADQARQLSSPVVFLSGGSDSALLVHLLRQSRVLPTTWTAVFDTPTGRVEGKLAAAAAAHYGAPWHSATIDKATTLEHLPNILDQMKEPFADVALVPEAVLGLAMRREMGDQAGRIGVFEGEGMDSLMCGSYKFVVERYRRWLAPLLAVIPTAAVRDADRRSSGGAFKLKVQQMKALLEGKEVFERHLRFLLDDDFGRYVPAALQAQVAGAFRSGYDLLPELDGLSRLAMMTFQGNVPNLENRKLQAISACAGIDFRLTYQDPRFIRLAISVPVRSKIGLGYGKRIVKEAFRENLPPHALTRRKASFVPPIIDWIWPECEELLLSSELFEGEEIHRRLQEHLNGRRDHLSFLWGLLVTNSWIRRYEDKAMSRRGGQDLQKAMPENSTTATSTC
jgi:asparagine synthase (glutamine-hydrolysing)